MEENFDPLAKERGEVLTRDMLVPGDMAPHSWQIKYLNNQAEFRLIVYLGNIGLRFSLVLFWVRIGGGRLVHLPRITRAQAAS